MTERALRIQSETSSDRLHLAIEDKASSTVLARFELNQEQIWTMLRGGSITLTGEMSDSFSRIGKTLVTESVDVPALVIKGLPYDLPLREHASLEWAKANHPGWSNYSLRRNNAGGFKVTMRKWVA